MENLSEIMQCLEAYAPQSLALDWDNVGLLVQGRAEVEKVLLCLDVTDAAVEKARREGFDLIVSHHPLLFKAVKRITEDSPVGRRILRLIEGKVSVFSAHSNLDCAAGGLNDILFDQLRLTDKEVLVRDKDVRLHGDDQGRIQGIGRVGRLAEPLTLEAYAAFVGRCLDFGPVNFYGDSKALLDKVALCTGSGFEYYKEALRQSCGCYLTGDCKYHQIQELLDSGLFLIDIPHYHSEIIFADPMKQYLSKLNLTIEVHHECLRW